MKRPKEEKQESYSEGNLDERTIAYFLRHLDNLEAPQDVRHKLKTIMVELVSNILVHTHSGYGSVSMKHEDGTFVIRTSNFAPPEKISSTIALATEIRGKGDLREHYLSRLAEVSYDKQVSLGLIEIFRLSNGNIEISSSLVDDRPAIHFEITVKDGSETKPKKNNIN